MRSRKKNSNDVELNRFNSLPWNPSSTDSEPLDVNIGSNELEGGFLSLEEIEEADFVFGIPCESETQRERKSKSRKTTDDSSSGVSVVINDEGIENEEVKDSDGAISRKKRKKRKKIGKNKKNINNKNEEDSLSADNEAGRAEGNDTEEDFVEDPDFFAWNELRLHPLLMRSIYRLGFKDPTPIQKACFPAAAHQGKDVIGAAETGSGKTLAFGLPILQRLLEEREKVERMRDQIGDESQRFAPKGVLRALIVTPTRELAIQVSNHLKEASKGLNIFVVPIVGGISTEKQERLLKLKPEVVVGTPGRLWELISTGEKHLTELHSLSFFVLDEADRMIENGHFQELQNIIDMLPNGTRAEGQTQVTIDSNVQRKKRQTFVFSATLSLSADFRKKLKRSSLVNKSSNDLNSIEKLSQRAGMKPNASIIDLTSASIVAHKLEESFIECREEDKDAYLYYILSIHGQGRVIVFCTSVAALRHISAILRILGVNIWTLHAQMQQRARLKAIDRFRYNENGILVATDVAARGIDIPGVRTVIHYQLPHSSEVYVHRSGRTARAFTDGCTIALISPNEISKFASLCKSLSRESFQRFPVEESYMPEVMKRLSLARQIDKIMRKDAQEKSKKTWLERNAQAVELDLDNDDSEDERVNVHKRRKLASKQLDELQQELNTLLSRPLQPKSFSRRYLAGAGVSPMLQNQLEELARQRVEETRNDGGNKKRKLVVIGQDCVEPLQALKNSGKEVRMNCRQTSGRTIDSIKRKRQEIKKRLHDQRRKQRKKMKGKL